VDRRQSFDAGLPPPPPPRTHASRYDEREQAVPSAHNIASPPFRGRSVSAEQQEGGLYPPPAGRHHSGSSSSRRGREGKRGMDENTLPSGDLYGGLVDDVSSFADKRGGARDKTGSKAPRLSTPELNERLRLEKLRQYEGQRPDEAYR